MMQPNNLNKLDKNISPSAAQALINEDEGFKVPIIIKESVRDYKKKKQMMEANNTISAITPSSTHREDTISIKSHNRLLPHSTFQLGNRHKFVTQTST